MWIVVLKKNVNYIARIWKYFIWFPDLEMFMNARKCSDSEQSPYVLLSGTLILAEENVSGITTSEKLNILQMLISELSLSILLKGMEPKGFKSHSFVETHFLTPPPPQAGFLVHNFKEVQFFPRLSILFKLFLTSWLLFIPLKVTTPLVPEYWV